MCFLDPLFGFHRVGVDQVFCSYNLTIFNQNPYKLLGPTEPQDISTWPWYTPPKTNRLDLKIPFDKRNNQKLTNFWIASVSFPGVYIPIPWRNSWMIVKITGCPNKKRAKLDTTPKAYHASAQRIITKEVVQNILSFLNWCLEFRVVS